MERQARAGHDLGGRLRLEWPDLWQPVPDRQGNDWDQLERPSLLRPSSGKDSRGRGGRGSPNEQKWDRRLSSEWRVGGRRVAMKDVTIRRSLRSAIYTRVSTEQGLERDFNSLDAQREASEAYIKSQAHEGRRLARDRYDDGGYSDGLIVARPMAATRA